MKKAYDNWMHVIEYDGNSLLSSKVHRDSGSLGSGIKTGPHVYLSSTDPQLSLPSLPSFPVAVPPEQPSMNPGHVVGGKKLMNLIIYRSRYAISSQYLVNDDMPVCAGFTY